MLAEISPMINLVRSKSRYYWSLTKSLQTGLLLITGLAGYMSCKCPVLNLKNLLMLTGSLFLAISGSTILNMWFDRDIDARMQRTCRRPLPSGQINHQEGFIFGATLAFFGVTWALAIDLFFGVIVFTGIFFDVVIYTIWLKRRTAWSIIWGGFAGGMPVLAGRVLGIGEIDWIGIALALAVLFWIPTHILTFSMRYQKDYQGAGVPTFPSRYGLRITKVTISIASILAAMTIGLGAYGIGMSWGYLRLLAVLSVGLLFLAIGNSIHPSDSINFGLFKYASIYMLCSMLLMVLSYN